MEGFVLVGDSETGPARRSRIEIMVCILGNSGRDSGMARLTQTCDLTSRQFNVYRDFLIGSGLLEVSTTEGEVEIMERTVKGEEFLREYREIEGLQRL